MILQYPKASAFRTIATVFFQLLLKCSFRVPKKKSSSPSQMGANHEISAPKIADVLEGIILGIVIVQYKYR